MNPRPSDRRESKFREIRKEIKYFMSTGHKQAFAPQNAFLENIVRKANNNNSYRCFVLANARIKRFSKISCLVCKKT